jgi:hypothetical protein
MNRTIKGSLIAGLAVFAFIASLRERLNVANLRVELAGREQQHRKIVALADRNRRLEAMQPSAGERANLRAIDEERSRLRQDIAKQQAGLREPVAPPAVRARVRLEPVEIEASKWKSAGFATPQSTVETALWAAAGGDVETLARTLVLEGKARTAAEQLLAGLPVAAKSEYSTPERLVALLAAKELMAGAPRARLSADIDEAAGEAAVRVRLRDAVGATQIAALTLKRQSDGWRVVVSERAVARLATLVKGGATLPRT